MAMTTLLDIDALLARANTITGIPTAVLADLETIKDLVDGLSKTEVHYETQMAGYACSWCQYKRYTRPRTPNQWECTAEPEQCPVVRELFDMDQQNEPII